MADGESYPVRTTDNNDIEKFSGVLTFTDSADQPSPSSGGIVAGTAFAPTGLTGAVSVTRYVGGTATVAPTTGTFAVGDYVISLNGSAWVCTVAGSPGTWVELGSVLLAPLASPTFTGTVTVPAAAAVTSATKLADLSSYLTIASGTLPNTGAWVSDTAKQNPVTRAITVNVECVFDGTANAATVVIAISSDNVTYTTVGTPGVSAAINTVGDMTMLCPVSLPKAWYIKLTIATHASVAASIYY